MKTSGFLREVALTLCLLASSMLWLDAGAQGTYADVNGDGRADISDVTSLIDFIV